jgi:hypothetical protein
MMFGGKGGYERRISKGLPDLHRVTDYHFKIHLWARTLIKL